MPCAVIPGSMGWSIIGGGLLRGGLRAVDAEGREEECV